MTRTLTGPLLRQKTMTIQAKDLVRIRKHQDKFVNFIAQMRAVSLQMTV